jgi:alcohol dehydrogenase-like protein
MRTMRAAVIYEAGGPEVLRIENRPVPVPQPGEVLIVVNAFGLNRSELFTRQGPSPDVTFPRVLGIEAVGVVDDAPGNQFASGDIVATAMDGMGREFDGGYAKYTCSARAGLEYRARLGGTWRSSGDAADRLGLAVQVTPSRRGRAAAGLVPLGSNSNITSGQWRAGPSVLVRQSR